MTIRIKDNQVPKKEKFGQSVRSNEQYRSERKSNESNDFDSLFKESCKKYSTSI